MLTSSWWRVPGPTSVRGEAQTFVFLSHSVRDGVPGPGTHPENRRSGVWGESGLDGASGSALWPEVQGQVLKLLPPGTQPLRERRSEQRGKTVLWGPS